MGNLTLKSFRAQAQTSHQRIAMLAIRVIIKINQTIFVNHSIPCREQQLSSISTLNSVFNSSVIICDSEKKNEDSVDTCKKCLELEVELVKKNDVYIELSKRSLQAKDTIISKLKETIHSLRENANPAKVKKDIDEIKTINIELEHSVAKLLSENEKLHKEKEHLKKTYKELYDSIETSRVHSKEQCDSLIVNLNSKSMENADLKAQIQEKVFANAALKNELRKLKRKTVIDTVVSKPHVTTTAPGMFKLDLEPLAPKVDSHKQKDSNQPLLHSTGLMGSIGDSGSKPTGNIKNNRISQSSSSNNTNKVEDQSRSVKSRKNKKNHVAKTECNAYVMQSMLNANSKSVYVICNWNGYSRKGTKRKPKANKSKQRMGRTKSKENTDDSLKQHQITDTETSSVKSSLKVDKDWKEKFFYPANHVRDVEPKKVRENNDGLIIEDWVSDDEDDNEPKVEKKTVIPTATKK
ncbi:hypothetical protein Tco_0872837 [Tanacetum coccineum]